MKRRSAILTEAKKFAIIEEDIPALQPHEVLIEMVACGLCHSDMPTYLGTGAMGFTKYGHLGMNEITYPTIVGHETVGIVIEVGSDVKSIQVGDYVGGTPLSPGFTTHMAIPEAMCIPIPKTIPREELKYCLAEPLMCVANIVQAANPALGDTIAVVGCGMMGLLTIAGLSHSSASKIIAVDVQEERLEVARKYGATHTINPANCDLTAAVDEITNSEGADIVVEITGSLRGLKTAMKVVRYQPNLGSFGRRGKVLMPSLYGREETWDPEVGYEMMYRAPIMLSTHPGFATDYMKTARDGVEAYSKGVLPLKDMITHEFKLDDISQAFEMLEKPKDGYLKGIIVP